jgi:hypothetical protein
MLELVLAFALAVSVIVIHVFRNNNKKQEQPINAHELWPVSFFLIHEPKMEEQHEWFVTSATYFQNYDQRLLSGVSRKDAWRIIALATRTNNLERISKNGFQAYRINGYIMRNKESKFVVRNGNGKLASVQISKITAFRVLHDSKIN